MGTTRSFRSSDFIIFVLFVAFSIFHPIVSANQRSLVIGLSTSLLVSPSLAVENSPGLKPGTKVVCERVDIRGLSRLHDLKKFAHSVKVKVLQNSSSLRRPNVEVCFHRNASLGVGMCPHWHWEKVSKGSWFKSMSPFDHKILDLRVAHSSLETVEVAIEEEFFLYRIIFLISGIILLSIASTLSKSLVFYYGSAMAVGVILVILVVLFQGMKLLPTGRKNSLAIFMYSSLVSINLHLFNLCVCVCVCVIKEYMQILRSIFFRLAWDLFSCGTCQGCCDHYLQRSESTKTCTILYLAIFLLAFVVLAGAWLGFWVVHKFVLAEDGSIDISTANFVAWSIRILAVIMILQSSLDPLLAAEALISGIVVSSVLRKVMRLRFLRRVFKKLFKLVKNCCRLAEVIDLSPLRDSYEEFTYKRPKDFKFVRRWSTDFSLAPCISPKQVTPGITRTYPRQLSDSEIYPSAFHTTPERRKFSKEDWEKFTKDSTDKAVKELVSSPDFNRWVAANAERITVTPRKISSHSSGQRRKWFLLF